jgi:serine/threonine-protein kinase
MVADRLAAALSDRYTIERELGAGGMATVYLAQDLKHDRQVALKVLRPELAAVIGAERFLHEIKTTANLQHPHILPLFDSGTVDGTVFYVMPFVAGETLRDRLSREKQLSIDDAVRIAREVASALDYAHRHGVIHRDIKPENILLHDGQALVADFGIALAASGAGGSRMTETGMSLGTPHYMSPEQAMGEREITARSDVYALGCVTYEMLTGDPPFTGSTAQAIVAQVITEDPRPPTLRRKTIPPAVEDAVLTALAKLPADRFATAAEFSAALAGEGGSGRGFAARRVAAGHRVLRPSGQPALLVAALLLTAAVAAWGWLRPAPVPPVLRYGLALPESQAPLIGAPAPTPSPDGSFLVYLGPGDGGNQLWVKRRDRYEATPISGTVGSQSFTLSPDGEWLAFIVNGRLNKIPMGGGPPVLLTSEDVSGQFGLAWLADGTIIYPMRAAAGLRRVSVNGGAAEVVWRSDSLVSMLPSALPDGHGVIFVSCLPGCVEGQLWALDLEANTAHPVVRGASEGVVVSSGHLVYRGDDGGLFASVFDLGRLQVSGAPLPLGDQLASNVGNQLFRISASGTLVMYAGGSAVSGRTFDMIWVDRNGRETPVDTAWTFQLTATANNHGWALSPDGSRLAIGVSTPAGDDIWVKPLPAGAAYRVTFDPLPDSRPRWTSDSRYITFRADRRPNGLYWRRADGSGADSLLVEGIVDEGLITPDNRWIVLRQGSVGQVAGGRNITGVRIGADSTPRPVLATDFDEMAMAFSPDGRWMAYQSDETGQTEVFVRPFPDTDAGKAQVSSGGGLAPVWSRDGQELFYLSSSRHMMAAPVAPGPALVVGAPEALFRVRDELLGAEALYYAPWDVARDGRFLMARLIGGDPGREASLVVVENWIEELKARAKR